MKIKFEENLEYQLDAINSITDIFLGQEVNKSIFTVEKSSNPQLSITANENQTGTGNKISLIPEQISENLNKIQKQFQVSIIDRDGLLKIIGEEDAANKAKEVLLSLLKLSQKGTAINEQNVNYAISLTVKEGKGDALLHLDEDLLARTALGKPVKPKTLGQKAYVDAIRKNMSVTLILLYRAAHRLSWFYPHVLPRPAWYDVSIHNSECDAFYCIDQEWLIGLSPCETQYTEMP